MTVFLPVCERGPWVSFVFLSFASNPKLLFVVLNMPKDEVNKHIFVKTLSFLEVVHLLGAQDISKTPFENFLRNHPSLPTTGVVGGFFYCTVSKVFRITSFVHLHSTPSLLTPQGQPSSQEWGPAAKGAALNFHDTITNEQHTAQWSQPR